jgi:hypothetical protein
VTRKVSDRGLVEASSGVDVDRVGDVFGRFSIVDGRVKSLVLASWCEEQAAIWSESQTAEKGR